ncbi:MAG: lactate dehydrogenase [Lachnospiraceae bacterium]|nr:lactate dehydrogenase [Solobacterium sp.]MBR3308960.1 lactate dehydrogenase [Lachnospiraceae bacterium]
MKIMFYFLRPFDELPFCEEFSKEFGIEYDHVFAYPTAENVILAKGCDAVSTTPCDMGAEMLERFAELGVKYLCCRSIGYDHIDLKKAKELGMKVSNASYPPQGVANYAVMLIMMCLRKIMPIMKRAEIQDFSLEGKMGHDISRCTIGVIGTGRIGTTVIRSLSGFGCRILAHDIFENEEAKQYAEYVSMDRLLAESDVITLHTNITQKNSHILNEEAFAKCKNGVIIVNTARGGLIDTGALIHALSSGKAGGAALDVLENENGLYYYNRQGDIIANDEMAILRSFPNVILSPHTAFYTDDAIRFMVRSAFESAYAFSQGAETPHEIKLP